MVSPKARLAPAASAPFDLTYRDGEEKDMRRRRILQKQLKHYQRYVK